MGRAWVLSNWPGRLLWCVLIAGASAKLVPAQTQPKAHPSPAPRTIILPSRLVAGEQATLAVIDTQGRLLPNVAVELSGGQSVTTDGTGRALFKAISAPGAQTAKTSGPGVTASATVVNAVGAQSAASASPAVVAKVISYPQALAIHDRFSLEGSGFRGAADSNRVYLDGDPCLVVASSPVSLVVLPGPRVPIGDVSLRIDVAGINAGQFPVSAVLLEITGPSATVNAGSDGELVVHARGTTQPLVVEVRNASPAVIRLAKGNVQRLKTSGGDENIAPVAVNFKTGGNYAVLARLVP